MNRICGASCKHNTGASRKMESNQIVLSFYESLLRISDIELLRGPCWLNDTLISFYFEYLEESKFKQNSMYLFVSPQVTQCIKVTPPSEITIFLDPLNSKARDFIFFALNDNEQIDSSGGSHWSLLVFSYPERMVFHFDSSRGMNHEQAMEFGHKLLRFFGLPSVGCYSEPQCLQQSNGYDCGIHVLCNAEQLAGYALKHRKIEGCPLLDKSCVQSKRREILDLIQMLRVSQK